MTESTLQPVSERKQAECDDCAAVFDLVKWIPLKFSCCKSCGSLKIRLYKDPAERKRKQRK